MSEKLIDIILLREIIPIVVFGILVGAGVVLAVCIAIHRYCEKKIKEWLDE